MSPDDCARNEAIRSAPTLAVHTPIRSVPLRAMSDFSHRERVFLRHDPRDRSQGRQESDDAQFNSGDSTASAGAIAVASTGRATGFPASTIA